MERKIIQKPNKFKVGQITFCNGGCTMQLPTFYKVVKRTEKTVWLIELESQLIEDSDGYGQEGHKIPVDIPKGTVFYSCLLYTSPSPRDKTVSRMPSSA